MAICTHPRCGDYTLVGALWNAQQDTAAQVATATGKQLAAVVAWVRRHSGGQAGPYSTPAQRRAITETEHRWAAWSSNSPARAAFLLTSSFDFTCEDDLFAAGAAVCAPPAATS